MIDQTVKEWVDKLLEIQEHLQSLSERDKAHILDNLINMHLWHTSDIGAMKILVCKISQAIDTYEKKLKEGGEL